MRTLVVLMLLTVPITAAAQRLPPNADLPLDHWTMPYLEHLIARGVIADPTPLVRPWIVSAIGRAVAAADTTDLSGADRATLALLRHALVPESADLTLATGAEIGVRAATDARRTEFDLRPAGPGNVVPIGGFTLGMQFGPGLLVMHPEFRGDFYDDPDIGATKQPVPGRFAEAYVAYRSRLLDVDFGNVSRNWGPPMFPGLLFSNWTPSIDHLYLRFGPQIVSVTFVVAQLDKMANQNGDLSNRYFYAGRLQVRPARWIDLAAWQGTIASGPGRNIDLWFLNPFKTTFQSRDEHQQAANVWLGGDGEMRLGRFKLDGSLTIDDWQLFKSGTAGDKEPPSYAGSASVTTYAGPVGLRLGYTRVTNLMYRTPDPSESPITGVNPTRGIVGTGLARNYSDYDQATFLATFIPLPGVLLEPEITWLRQGEGDFRLPFPTVAEYPTTPTFLAGIVERTWRLALRGSLRLPLGNLPLGGTVEGDAGVHFVSNAQHVQGAKERDFVGSLIVRLDVSRLWPVR
jgi:hypothetical protein